MSTEAKITLYLTVEDELFDPEYDKLPAIARELDGIVSSIKYRISGDYGRMVTLDDWETEPAQRR